MTDFYVEVVNDIIPALICALFVYFGLNAKKQAEKAFWLAVAFWSFLVLGMTAVTSIRTELIENRVELIKNRNELIEVKSQIILLRKEQKGR